MSGDFGELEKQSSTADMMEVDTTFLDAYRSGGRGALQRLKEQADAEKTAAHDATLEVPESELVGDSPQHGRAGSGGSGGGAPADATGSGVASTIAQATAAEPETTVLDEGTTDDMIMADHEGLREEVVAPVSLRLTDHQEAVQNPRTSSRGGSDSTTALPQSGFRLSGVKSQPAVRALPEIVVHALREQLRSAAVRELRVSDEAAREFSERLSQVSLVTAFLLSKLDLGMDMDPATARAAELFRSCDPLLGSVLGRLTDLEAVERDTGALLRRMRRELAEVRTTSGVIEQMVSYSVADRTENFLRGSHNIHDAPITHKDALFLRDHAREATRRQAQIEQDQEGRPTR